MTRRENRDISKELEQDRQEMLQALNQSLEHTIRQAWRVNTAAWLLVAVGAFVLNLLLLVLVTGG